MQMAIRRISETTPVSILQGEAIGESLSLSRAIRSTSGSFDDRQFAALEDAYVIPNNSQVGRFEFGDSLIAVRDWSIRTGVVFFVFPGSVQQIDQGFLGWKNLK